MPVCNGTFAITDYDEDFTSWTVGANYSFTDSMSAYVRVNRGGHFLDFDNGIRGTATGNTPPDADDPQLRRGLQVPERLFYADISAYFRDFTGLQYTADRRERRADSQRHADLRLRIQGRELHRRAHAGRALPLPKWSPTIWMASTRTTTRASRSPTWSPATVARRSRGSSCSASPSCATC